jgi:hypothetical protein
LGRRYSEFLTREADASVQGSSLSIRMFQDTIIPLATQAAASPKATPVQGDASKIVWNLNSAFSKLYRLNDDYQREPGPQQEAMIGSLECLASLEEAIFLLREVEELESRCDFSDLLSSAMASQRNTTDDWHPPAGLLVAYGPYYRALNGYTPLMRAGPTGADTVRGYVAIVSQVAPSFPVKTVADLKKLQEFLDQRSAQIVSEYTPLSVDLPLLGTKVSRNILLWVGPLMILLLLHMVGFYVRRSARLMTLMEEDGAGRSEIKYRGVAPYVWLELEENQEELIGSTLLAQAATWIRWIVLVLVVVAIASIPLLVSMVLFISAENHLLAGLLILLFMVAAYAETYVIFAGVRRLAGRTEKLSETYEKQPNRRLVGHVD